MTAKLDKLQTMVAGGRIDRLSEADLLAIVISDPPTAETIIAHFGGYRGLAGQPLEKLLRYRGLGEAKIIRIAACFEMARRIVNQVLEIQQREVPDALLPHTDRR